MSDIYNIYCDESCHLEHDDSEVMILGAISCPEELKKDINDEIRRIKEKHKLDKKFEIKWTKVSKSKESFYLDLLTYFFRNSDLMYRCVVATGKKQLDHASFNDGEYDKWYYKMYYYLLYPMTPPHYQYRIFVDKKDTRGGPRIAELHEALCNKKLDFDHDIIKDVRQIQSHESDIMQITDLLNGAMAYYHRRLHEKADGNDGKKHFLERLIGHYNINPMKSTSPYEDKFNIFIWSPRGKRS